MQHKQSCHECGLETEGVGRICSDCITIKRLKARGAGLAASTKGRKTRFEDKRRKERSRRDWSEE